MRSSGSSHAGLCKARRPSRLLHALGTPTPGPTARGQAGASSLSRNDVDDQRPSVSKASTTPGSSSLSRSGAASPSHDETDVGVAVQNTASATAEGLYLKSVASSSRSQVEADVGVVGMGVSSTVDTDADQRSGGSASPSQNEADGGLDSTKAPSDGKKQAEQQSRGSASPSQNEADRGLGVLAADTSSILPDITERGGPALNDGPLRSQEERPRSFLRTPHLVVLPGNVSDRRAYDLVEVIVEEFRQKRLDLDRDAFLMVELPDEVVASMETSFPTMLSSCFRAGDAGSWENVSAEETRVTKLTRAEGVFVMSSVGNGEQVRMHHFLGVDPSAAATEAHGESGWTSLAECFVQLTADEADSNPAPGVQSAAPLSLHMRLLEDPLSSVSKNALPRVRCDLDSEELYGSADAPDVTGWRLRLGREFSAEHMQSVKYGLMRLNILMPKSHDRIWLGINQTSLKRLNEIILGMARGKNSRTTAGVCSNVVDHQRILLEPSFLDANGIDYFCFTQKASEVVVTLPGAVFQTVSTGPGFTLERHVAVRQFWVKTARERVRCARSCNFFVEDSDQSDFAPIRRLIYDAEKELVVREPEAVRMFPEVDLKQPLKFNAHAAVCEAPAEDRGGPAPSKMQVSVAVQKACHDVRGSRAAWDAFFRPVVDGDDAPSTVSRASQRTTADSSGARGTHATKHDQMVVRLTQQLEVLRENGDSAEVNKVAEALAESKRKQAKCVREHDRADRIYAQLRPTDNADNVTPSTAPAARGERPMRKPASPFRFDEGDVDGQDSVVSENEHSAPLAQGNGSGPETQGSTHAPAQQEGVPQATANVVVGATIDPVELGDIDAAVPVVCHSTLPHDRASTPAPPQQSERPWSTTAAVRDCVTRPLTQIVGVETPASSQQASSVTNSRPESVNGAGTPGPSGVQKRARKKTKPSVDRDASTGTPAPDPAKRARVRSLSSESNVTSQGDTLLRQMSVSVANKTAASAEKQRKALKCKRAIAENPNGPAWARKLGPKRVERWLRDQEDRLEKYQGEVARVENELIEWEKTRIVYKALRAYYAERNQKDVFIDKLTRDGYTNPMEVVAAFWLSESQAVRNALFLKIIVTTPEAFENNPEKLEAWMKHFESAALFDAFFQTKTNVRIAAKDF